MYLGDGVVELVAGAKGCCSLCECCRRLLEAVAEHGSALGEPCDAGLYGRKSAATGDRSRTVNTSLRGRGCFDSKSVSMDSGGF